MTMIGSAPAPSPRRGRAKPEKRLGKWRALHHDGMFKVESASEPGTFYTVDVLNNYCTCPATVECKHLKKLRAVYRGSLLNFGRLQDELLPKYRDDAEKAELVRAAIELRIDRLARQLETSPARLRASYIEGWM